LKKLESTNAFFPFLHNVAKHYGGYLGLNPSFDLNVHVIICGTGSDIFYPKHMFPNPVVPFTYPPHLSMFEILPPFQNIVDFFEIGRFPKNEKYPQNQKKM